MAIEFLMLQGVRNLAPLSISPSQNVNLIYGENGSGKTSLLEALYLLSLGRSFRTHKQKSMIQHEQEAMTAFCKVDGKDLGIERTKAGERRIKLDGEWIKSAVELATLVPVQLLDPTMFKLLEGSPQLRRQFLDWGVFHVEHNFISIWRDMKKCLDARNGLLRRESKSGQPVSEMEKDIWHNQLAEHANNLNKMRQAYLADFKPVFDDYMHRLNPELDVTMSFYQGWGKERDYLELLNEQWDSDTKQGFTQLGPQRADLRMKVSGQPAMEVLSRGQQKMVVCAMKLAQASLYQKAAGKPCIFLVDDLAAELDLKHRNALCGLLEELKCQVFVTAIDASQIADNWSSKSQIKRFHVEHGTVHQE